MFSKNYLGLIASVFLFSPFLVSALSNICEVAHIWSILPSGKPFVSFKIAVYSMNRIVFLSVFPNTKLSLNMSICF